MSDRTPEQARREQRQGETDMDAKRDEIRDRLRSAAALRQEADEAKAEATKKLTSALADAADNGISHAEASRLGGVTRNGAYELLRKAAGA